MSKTWLMMVFTVFEAYLSFAFCLLFYACLFSYLFLLMIESMLPFESMVISTVLAKCLRRRHLTGVVYLESIMNQ